ncbi:uncharacterized protein LOC117535174 isoform X2 [Gymnodraco acuticeps]|uniref:Uncharacterized protein LOC117535174 isoform X2 n=1 Tax=Gymnodraco acuticeps TaxID=8218 RepID=A0A6P8T9P9_GYMAC|nr:uncharacterized protein LOC117535174 isoform X2 [Gymnodraco acuticeps]
MLEEFKNCVPERTVVYLNEQKLTTLQQAASLADEFALIHKSVFFQRDPPQQDTYRRDPDNYVPCASVRVLNPRLDRACFFCLDPGHVIADCAAWKRKQTADGKHPEGVGLVTAVCPSGRATVSKGPDECLKPFISTAFVSLSGRVEDQRQVTVLRDSGGSQSFILAGALPLSAESACDANMVVRVAVLPKFPVDGVDVIMGPDTKRLCFSCLDPGHLVAECVAWKEQVAASKHSKVTM